ncbi:hypothetical protein [Wolbachia endosymbiont (group A) of Pogonocherus hispidulus]|uniref:hypothetical protein n=1 Tax=Wolbachia endosymbiont (group A) of Pogonocherus hispidulus TaxID=3066136 RepID=UPI003341946D
MTLESRKLNFTPGNKNWIPVSGHWDDTLLVAQRSYSYVSATRMTGDNARSLLIQ